MKYARWLLSLSLLVCFLKSFNKQPFFKELPMLLLPEQSFDMSMRRKEHNVYDDILDPRPICIQTQNNYSTFQKHNNWEENYIISYLKDNFTFNGATLLDDKITIITSKDFSQEVVPVWATKSALPMNVAEPKKQIFVPKSYLYETNQL